MRKKRRSNLRSISIDFADAVTALDDPDALTIPDDESDDEEDRFVTLGADLFWLTPDRCLYVAR